MEKKLKKQDIEELVLEVIKFLQKWGLWVDVSIFAKGNRYSHTYKKDQSYKGMACVECAAGINPEDFTTGPTESGIDNDEVMWKSYSNIEHIFDMVYEGPLYMLLRHDEYEVKKSDISEEAWEYIFKHTDILSDKVMDWYDCTDVTDLLDQIVMNKFDNPEYSAWDPLVFDTWEEYQNLVGCEDACLTPNYQRFDTYAEYLGEVEAYEVISVEDVMPLWEKMVSDAKNIIRKNCDYDSNKMLYLPEIAGQIQSEFTKLFEHYGLWFDFGFSWSLTCYEKRGGKRIDG